MKPKRIDGYVVCVAGEPATAALGRVVVVFRDRADADRELEPQYSETLRRVRVEVGDDT